MNRPVSPLKGRQSLSMRSMSTGREEERKRPLKVIGKELPDIESVAAFQAAWKITKAKEEDLLLEFRNALLDAGVLRPEHDKYYLRRFLRARQHDISRAREMFLNHLKWRKSFGTDGILENFQFHERDAIISLYPQGYHKTDKLGRPIYIQHVGSINIKKINEITNEERMLKFHVQEYERCVRYIMPACSKVAGHHIDQTFAIIDVTGVGLGHLTGQVKKMLDKITSIDSNNYPEMMGKTFVINAPSMFKVVWGAVKRFLDARTIAKIELCSTNYQSTLLKYVDKENLPEYLGGTSKSTLVDDAGPWQDPALIAEIEADYRAALRYAPGKESERDGTKMEAVAALSAAADLAPVPERATIEASTTGRGEPGPRGASPPRRSASLAATSRRPLQLRTSQNGDAPETPFADSLQQQSMASAMSEDDAAYYSPKSEASSYTSFTERGQELDASAQLEAFDPAKVSTDDGQGRQISIMARVRALEEAIPGLATRLAPDMDLKQANMGSFTRMGGHGLMGRVEALEGAIEVLLAAQEAAVSAGKQPSEDHQGKATCGCCTIM